MGSAEDMVNPGEFLGRLIRRSVSAESVRALLESIPLDQPSFRIRFGSTRAEVLHAARETYERDSTDGDAGFLGLFLLTTLLVEDFDLRRGDATGQVGRRASVLAECDRILRDPLVRRALRDVYHPMAEDAPSTDAATVWHNVDVDSLELHRLGSTSVILSAVTSAQSPFVPGRDIAVKCVLLPFTRIAAIGNATAEYAPRYHREVSRRDGKWPFTPSVFASTRTWIVMDFVPGPTLAEVLGAADRPARRPAGGLDLDRLARYLPAIFDSLDELHRQRHDGRPWVHADLSPSNIIVRQDGSGEPVAVTLIDLGHNFLYSRAISALGGGEGAYVAPEVKADELDDGLADVYSLGKLIILIGGETPPADSIIPDSFYERVPALARFVEDLLDPDPSRRLLSYGNGDGERTSDRWDYRALRDDFVRELAAVRAAEAAGVAGVAGDDRPWLADVRDMLRPSSRAPQRYLQLYRQRIAQAIGARGSTADGRSAVDRRQAGWLATWSLVAVVSFWAAALVLTKQIARDLGIDPTPQLVDTLDALAQAQHIQFLSDALAWFKEREDAWLGPAGMANAPARIVAVSFILVNIKYYQNIFAGLTPLMGQSLMPTSRRVRAWATDILMRLFSWWWVPMVVLPNLGHPDWWPIATAIGLTTSFFLNYAASSFAVSAVRQAADERIATVPSRVTDITGLRMFAQWTPSMAVFAVIVWITGLLVVTDRLHDEIMYAVMLALLNIGIFYALKCTINAPEIRVGLARAFLASERTYVLKRGLRARDDAVADEGHAGDGLHGATSDLGRGDVGEGADRHRV